MLDRFGSGGGGSEALVRYSTPDFQVLSPGSHVVCAVTGERIPLDELRYWSVERQEPYADVAAASAAEEAAQQSGGQSVSRQSGTQRSGRA